MKFILTATDKSNAKTLAKRLIKAKIAACVSILKANSIFFWDDKLSDEKERILLIKSSVKFKKIAKFISSHHSYELPEIVAFRVDKATKKYKKWIKKESK